MPRQSSSEPKSLSSNIIAVLNTPAASTSPSPEPTLTSTATMVGCKSNARRSPKAEIPLPITYTPTTHRISKAKKGKRVHACEFPGCDKVFTRAEHRRRHELNHNPEASFRCTWHGCKRAFHRADLLARHMERHELEPQTKPSQWESQSQTPTPVMSEASIPRCLPVEADPLLADTSQPSDSMSIGSIVAPGVHPDLANDCSLMWNGMDLPLQPRPSANMFQNQLPPSADDSPFYSSPAETCPSPMSDTTYSAPPHTSSSISSASVSAIDQYPKDILNTEMISSPLQMPSPLRWDGSESISISMEENLVQPPVQCHYPSPPWSSTDCLPYDEQVQSLAHFHPIPWKQWTIQGTDCL